MIIKQQASIYFGEFSANEKIDLTVNKERYHWLQVLAGKIQIGNETLANSDGASFEPGELPRLKLELNTDTTLLLFELE